MTAWMKSVSRWVLLGVLCAGAASAQPISRDTKKLPVGWFITESAPQLYEANVDNEVPCEGERSAFLRSLGDSPDGYGTFMQAFGAQEYRGKRLRFSAMLKTRNVKGWAGLWMRVEGSDPKQPLAFDNMQSRALVGTVGCKRYDVVLDVPESATYITAGLLLSGTGQAWLGGVRFEVVSPQVPSTDLLSSQSSIPNISLATEGDPPAGRGEGVLGSVGPSWFTHDRIHVPFVERQAIQKTQVEAYKRTYERQASGLWKNSLSEELTEKDGEVRGELDQRTVRLKVKSLPGPQTRIEGTWGDHDVLILLGKDKLTMKWGFYERELVRQEDAPEDDPNCIRYQRVEGPRPTDRIDVCGAALGKNPPAVQLVAAFLANGFRRAPPGDSLPRIRTPVGATGGSNTPVTNRAEQP
ncbi:AraC family transcriptional regulator [Myxococcaceae bacterium GXIMD 01537]